MSNVSSFAFRTVIISGGMPSPQSFLRMMPCSPLLSVWKMDPKDTVGYFFILKNKIIKLSFRHFQVLIVNVK